MHLGRGILEALEAFHFFRFFLRFIKVRVLASGRRCLTVWLFCGYAVNTHCFCVFTFVVYSGFAAVAVNQKVNLGFQVLRVPVF